MQSKLIRDFKAGDVVLFHGAKFRIQADARVAINPKLAEGGCHVAQGEWIEGEAVRGYFGPGMVWTFQGNDLAGKYPVEGEAQ